MNHRILPANVAAWGRYRDLVERAASSLRCSVLYPDHADVHLAAAVEYATDSIGARNECDALTVEQSEIDAVLARWSA